LTGTEQTGSNVSIALVHYPVYDKNRQVVATAVTNLDLHDIARAARTYGLFRYYVVTPVAEQRELAERIGSHWLEGWGAVYNPERKKALELMRVVDSLDAAREEIALASGKPVKTGEHITGRAFRLDQGSVPTIPAPVRHGVGAGR
jgi:hypothetical protein